MKLSRSNCCITNYFPFLAISRLSFTNFTQCQLSVGSLVCAASLAHTARCSLLGTHTARCSLLGTHTARCSLLGTYSSVQLSSFVLHFGTLGHPQRMNLWQALDVSDSVVQQGRHPWSVSLHPHSIGLGSTGLSVSV